MTRYRWLGTLLAVIAAAGCGAPAGVDLETLLPEASELAGWIPVEGPVGYGPDDLYDYLDGGAERYLSYGFRSLVHVRYGAAGPERPGVTLDLFDMGSSLGAFGIYSAGRRPEIPPELWGVEGWTDGDVAHAWKGSVYLHGVADRADPEAAAMLRRVMALAASAVPGGPTEPPELAPLPVEGRMPRSERYVASDLMGHGFLGAGVLASYRREGHDARLFFSELGSESEADEAVARLRSHWQERARVEVIESPGRGGFRYSDAELGSGAVAAAGSYVAGVQCPEAGLSMEAQQRLLTDLVSRLPGADP